MDLQASVELSVAPERVYREVADLGTYPEWLGIVLEAEVATDGDGAAAAWYVELGARVGPVKAAKRVRMVRVVDDAPRHARFERAELDEEEHSPWVLDATVDAGAAGVTLTMRLHYGGTLFFPGLDRILGAEVDRAGERLQARLA